MKTWPITATHTQKKRKKKEKKRKKVGLWFYNKSSVQYVIMHSQVLER